jgi:osmotically-inducible protein OsmY
MLEESVRQARVAGILVRRGIGSHLKTAKEATMGWLKRMFGEEQDTTASANPQDQSGGTAIPAERMGLHGEFDQSGLAKRVALAFDQDPTVTDIDTVWVAQTGSTVVLKGQAPSQETVQKLVAIARSVKGTSSVEVDQVKIA